LKVVTKVECIQITHPQYEFTSLFKADVYTLTEHQFENRSYELGI